VPIIILSASDSESLALRLVQEGAQDYLLKSICTSDALAKAIQYALVRYVGPAPRDGAPRLADPTKVIGIIGAKGGVGATTVACNLALELRRQTGEKTLLVDLDVHGGLVGFLTNVQTETSIADAVTNYQRLDISVWQGIAVHGPDDLDIVRSPTLLGGSEINADRLRHVLTLIRPFYRQIVVDMGRLNHLSAILLDRINEVFLVTTTSVPALYEAKRTIGALRRAEFEGDRLRLIVNRHNNTHGYSGSDLDRVFGIPVYARLPDATRELNDAVVRGKMLAENSDYRGHMARLARKVAGLPEKNGKGPVSQLLSFVEKLR
jgi:pilus assembly protein CpaE